MSLQELPPQLAAVSVSLAGGGQLPSLARLVELFSQIAPLFSAVQTHDAAAAPGPGGPPEAVLLIFYSTAAAQQAVDLFHGCGRAGGRARGRAERIIYALCRLLRSGGAGPACREHAGLRGRSTGNRRHALIAPPLRSPRPPPPPLPQVPP